MAKIKQEFEFEQALEQLEEVVQQLESNQLTLQQSLAAFETGMQLVGRCQKVLQTAEQQVKIWAKEDQALVAMYDDES